MVFGTMFTVIRPQQLSESRGGRVLGSQPLVVVVVEVLLYVHRNRRLIRDGGQPLVVSVAVK